MATKYPTALDDTVTLGPTFIDVIPPVDPQRNIGAGFRNNVNDALVAIETRLGITDSTVNTSVDWGLLSVSGAPNQGVRFAGNHAAWPGLIAEDGIFVDTASGNVSYHKAGDPLATFTDLTAGGGSSTWDALLAASQTMDLDADAPLTWTQSDVSGYGFILQKTVATAAAALMKIETTNGTFAPAVPLLEVHRANAGAAMSINGYLNFGAIAAAPSKITSDVPFEISTSGASDTIDIKTTGDTGADITISTAQGISPPSSIVIDSGSALTLRNSGGTTADITIDSDSELNLVADEKLDINCNGGLWALGTANFALTHGGPTNTFIATLNGGGTTPNRITSVGRLTLETTAGTSPFLINSGNTFGVAAAQNINLSTTGADINLTANTNANSDVHVLVNRSFTVDATGGVASTITLDTSLFNVTATTCAFSSNTGPNTYAAVLGHTFTCGVTGVDSFTDYDFTVSSSNSISLTGRAGVTLSTDGLASGSDITIDSANITGDLFLRANASGYIPLNTLTDVSLATTKQSIIGAINEVNTAALTAPTWDAIYAADKVLDITGLSFTIDNNLTTASSPNFVVSRNNTSTGNAMVDFSDISTTSTHSTLIVGNGGTTGTAMLALGIGTHTGTVNVTTSGYWAFGALTTADINMYTTGMLADSGDTSGATYRGFYAVGSAVGNAVKHGFVSDALWDYGLYLLSPAYVATQGTAAAVPVLVLDQKDTDEAFINFVGQESANQTDSISNVAGDGPAVVGPLAKVGTSGWVFSKMVQVEINGNIEWIATYDVAP